jgi:hypothetical protein
VAEQICRCAGYVDSTMLHPGPVLASKQMAQILALTDRHCSLPPMPP